MRIGLSIIVQVPETTYIMRWLIRFEELSCLSETISIALLPH
jgi:hypothetical protein